jgi:hypothetical protein
LREVVIAFHFFRFALHNHPNARTAFARLNENDYYSMTTPGHEMRGGAEMSFSVQMRWVDGVPHLQLREADTGKIRMQWQLVRTWDAAGESRMMRTATEECGVTLASLIRQLFLVACTDDLRCFCAQPGVRVLEKQRERATTTRPGASRSQAT